MINKIVQSMADAMAGIKDGSTVLLAGFGSVGQPNALIDGLIEQGAKDLVVAIIGSAAETCQVNVVDFPAASPQYIE